MSVPVTMLMTMPVPLTITVTVPVTVPVTVTVTVTVLTHTPQERKDKKTTREQQAERIAKMKRIQTEERKLLIEAQRKEMEAAENVARAEMAAALEVGAAAAKFKEEQAAIRAQEERDRVETNRITLKQQRKIKKLEEIEAKERSAIEAHALMLRASARADEEARDRATRTKQQEDTIELLRQQKV